MVTGMNAGRNEGEAIAKEFVSLEQLTAIERQGTGTSQDVKENGGKRNHNIRYCGRGPRTGTDLLGPNTVGAHVRARRRPYRYAEER
jgi:hypothetical protein